MIDIINITQNMAVNLQFKYEGVGGVPTQKPLRPGEHFLTTDTEMKAFAHGVKSDVASYVSKAILQVNQSGDVHNYPDLDHIPDYAAACAQGPGPVLASACASPVITPTTLASDIPLCNPFCISKSNITDGDGLHWEDEVTGLETALVAFNTLRDMYDAHAPSTAYHPSAGVKMAGAPPIDLTTLLARLITLRTTFNTHIGAAAHVAADPVNTVPLTLPITDLKEAVEAIRVITDHFNSHRLQYVLVGTAALTPIEILTDAY